MKSMRYILILDLLAMVPGCSPVRNSQLKQLPKVEFPEDANGLLLMKTDEIYDNLDGFLRMGDRYRERADTLLKAAAANGTQEGFEENSARKLCEKTAKSEDKDKCLSRGNIPPAAAALYEKSDSYYMKVLNLFGKPEDKNKPIANLKASGCIDASSIEEYNFCRESGRTEAILKLSTWYMNRAVDPISGKILGSDNYALGVNLFNHGSQASSKLLSYRTMAFARHDTVRAGLSRGSDVISVPYLSLVSGPDTLLKKVSDYSKSWMGTVDKYLDAKKSELALNVNEIDRDAELKRLDDEMFTFKTTYNNLGLEIENLQTESKFLDDMFVKIKGQMDRNKSNFSSDFRAVMGRVENFQPLITKMLTITPATNYLNFHERLAPMGSSEPSAVPDFNQMELTIGKDFVVEVNAKDGSKYVSNAIYAAKEEPSDGTAQDKSWDDAILEQWLKSFKEQCRLTKKNTDSRDRFVPTKPPRFLRASQGDSEAAISGSADKLEREHESLAIGDMIAQTRAKEASPGAKLNRSPIPASGTNPLNLNCDELPGLDVMEHVRRQVTGPEGYVLSVSQGLNDSLGLGFGKGTSQGGNASIQIPLVGVGGGFDMGSSKSEDWNAGIGRSADLSQAIGFHHARAQYPQFRVGMLIAELVCIQGSNLQVIGAFPVGPANFFSIKGSVTSEKCDAKTSRLRLSFTINDSLEGRAATCQAGKESYACVSQEELISLSVTPYFSVQESYSNLLSFLNAPTFGAAIANISYSADPNNTAYQLFRQQAMASAIDVNEEIIEKFRPLIDNKVNELMNIKELVSLNNQTTQLANKVLQAIESREAANHTIGILESIRSLNIRPIADLLSIHKTVLKTEQTMAWQAAAYNLERFLYWLDLYENAVLYQYGTQESKYNYLASIRTLRTDIRQNFLNDFLAISDEAGLKLVRNKLVEFTEKISTMMDKAETFEWIRDEVTRETSHHCYLDLAQIVDLNKTLRFESQDVLELPPTLMTPDKAGYSSALAFHVTNNAKGSYYKISFRTDPNLRNLASYQDLPLDPYDAKVIDPTLHCDAPAKAVNFAKVQGVAVTFDPGSALASSMGYVLVDHEPDMYTYIVTDEGVEQSKVNRRIDFSSIDEGFVDAFRPKLVRFTGLAETPQSICLNVPGKVDWMLSGTSGGGASCPEFLMGTADTAQRKRFFHNSYLGGQWTLYLPYHAKSESNAMWNKFREETTHLLFHMYFRNQSSLH